MAIGGLQRRVQHLTHDLEAARSAQRGAEADAAEARRAAASAAAATAEAGVTMKRQLGAKSRQVENMAEKLLLQKKVRGAATVCGCACTIPHACSRPVGVCIANVVSACSWLSRANARGLL